MLWREATARLTRERQHPATTSHPSTGQGMEPGVSTPAPLPCCTTPSKITPRQGALCFAAAQKQTASSGLPMTWTKGPVLKSHSPMELLVLVPLGRVEGCGGTEVPSHGGDMAGEVKLGKSQPMDSPNTLCGCQIPTPGDAAALTD